MGDCSSPSGLAREHKGNTFVSHNHYNTSVKTPANTEAKSGRFVDKGNGSSNNATSAEEKALRLLQKWGYEAIQSPDWLARRDGQWICVEAKGKELWEAGRNFPYFGIGLERKQVYLRKQLLLDWKVRTILINFVPETNLIYGQYLDILEQGIHYDTPKQDIRIYPLENYKAIHDAPNQNLGGLM